MCFKVFINTLWNQSTEKVSNKGNHLDFPASALILFGLFYLLPASLFTPHLIPQLEYTGKPYGINPFFLVHE
jgi:hypothetical protein